MAIRPRKLLDDYLTPEEKAVFRVERRIDRLLWKAYRAGIIMGTYYITLTRGRLSRRVQKIICQKYEAAGWEAEIKKESDGILGETIVICLTNRRKRRYYGAYQYQRLAKGITCIFLSKKNQHKRK